MIDQTEEAQDALNKAKLQIMAAEDSVFITQVCFSLKFMWDNTIKTAATNGKLLKINASYWMTLSPAEQLFLLLHETWHVCFMHILRAAGLDPAKWNIAADHVINLMLISRGYTMPKGGYADRQYLGMHTKEIYNLLPANEDPNGFEMDLEDPSDEIIEEVTDTIIRAAIQSKGAGDKAGSIPGEVQIFIDNLLNPILPWYRILGKYFQAKSKSDYTMQKPNRRYFPDWYLPSLKSNKNLIDIGVAIDCSGSVSDGEFAQFVSEIRNIIKRLKPAKLSLISFDTYIRTVDEVKNVSNLMKIKFHGRGGTCIEPVIQWAKDNNPKVLLIFTDGGFRFHQPSQPAKTDVIWLIHNNPSFAAPIGKVIAYKT